MPPSTIPICLRPSVHVRARSRLRTYLPFPLVGRLSSRRASCVHDGRVTPLRSVEQHVAPQNGDDDDKEDAEDDKEDAEDHKEDDEEGDDVILPKRGHWCM